MDVVGALILACGVDSAAHCRTFTITRRLVEVGATCGLMLIVFGGLPGVGKSTLARALGRFLRAPVLSVDPIEAALWRAGIDADQPTGVAAYIVAEAVAELQLSLGLTTVVDAANYAESGRQIWRALAARRHEQLRWIEVICSVEAVHRARLEARGVNISGFYEVSWPDVLQRRGETEPWTDERLVLDTVASDDDALLSRVLAYVADHPSGTG